MIHQHTKCPKRSTIIIIIIIIIIITGRKIAPNTGTNATNFFTLATKS